MASEKNVTPDEINKLWGMYLTTGELPEFTNLRWYQTKRARAFYRFLPNNPRCRLCHAPFHGFGGAVMHYFFGQSPSRLNPQICNQCEQFIHRFKGGAEVEVTILFADVRGSTHLAETMNPTEFSRLINRFYNTATSVLYNSNAMVEKLIGDAATGFYTPGVSGPRHALSAVSAAREILHKTGHHQPEGPWVPVGIGVHTGMAYVGAVVSDSGQADIAVFGDTANIGARLAAQAAPGEIHISLATAQAAGIDPAGIETRRQTIKGRTEPIEVWVLSQ